MVLTQATRQREVTVMGPPALALQSCVRRPSSAPVLWRHGQDTCPFHRCRFPPSWGKPGELVRVCKQSCLASWRSDQSGRFWASLGFGERGDFLIQDPGLAREARCGHTVSSATWGVSQRSDVSRAGGSAAASPFGFNGRFPGNE